MPLHMTTNQRSMSISNDNNEKMPCHSTYASFGDEGVTATANSHGHLLQITRHFKDEPSGFYCVDLPDVPPLHSIVRRMEKLQNYFGDPHGGMRVHVESSEDADAQNWKANKDSPEPEFVQDRWPSFDTETPKFKLNTQYFISEKTVYQIYTFECLQGGQQRLKIPPLIINAKLLLRDLNFIADGDHYDRTLEGEEPQNYDSGEYSDCLSPGNDYIIRTANFCQAGQNNQNAIDFLIAPFINKRPQQLELRGESGDYQITIPNDVEAQEHLWDGDRLEITLAYRLELHDSPISSDSLSNALRGVKAMLGIPLKKPLFTQDRDLNFILRRNLEHILSVCSIPVANGDNPSIILTCGDISGHRISTAASFYSFQLLLLAHEHMRSSSNHVSQSENNYREDSYSSKMQSRIQRICRGHLKWLCESAVSSQDSSQNLLKQSLVNTSFQIIKAAEFCRVAAVDEDTKDEVKKGFQNIVKGWVEALDKQNKERRFAFPSVREESAQWVFNLSDHAIIWWAIKAANELGLNTELQVSEAPGPSINRQENAYSLENVRKAILKRFTIKNPLFEQGMLAVSRSCSETRFRFRAKDTVLFYTMDLGLFDQHDLMEDESDIWRNRVEAWRCTVDYQKECESGQNANWGFGVALALIMSSKNKRINSRTVSETYTDAKEILLQRSLPNRLSPGQLDESEISALFRVETTRDRFWSATFELPYILWRYQIPPLPIQEIDISVTATASFHQDTSPSSASLPISSTAPSTPDFTHELVRNRNTPVPSSEILIRRESPFMKHGVLFTNAIDQKQIVDIPDEWLYKEPRFLHTELTARRIEEFCQEVYKLHPKEAPKDVNDSSRIKSKWSLRKLSRKKVQENTDKQLIPIKHSEICTTKVLHKAAVAYDLEGETGRMGYIIDVPRAKRCKEINADYVPTEISSVNSLLTFVEKKRTPADAKKRIFQFFRPWRDIVPICYLASSEPKEMSSFFDRHASLDPYFFEDTTRTLNKWVTELHLPFYQIRSCAKAFISGFGPKRKAIPTPRIIPFPHLDLNGDNKSLIRSIISFRFDGDLLDRYWTCYLVEYNPQDMGDPNAPSFNITKYPVNGALKPNPWRQRRVLELILFERILQEILRNTQEILEEEKSVFKASKRVGSGGWGYGFAESQTKLSSQQSQSIKQGGDIFLSNDELWYQMQEILQEVQEDLSENLAKIKLWLHREDKRGPDKPRWTHKDEYHYGGAIHKLRASNNFYIEELERCSAKISAFNTQLTREMDNARSYWEIRTTNDVRLFTYVTVIFLPTSFAIGVFSMNGIPSKHMLLYMIVTAVVALLVTAIALFNAKTLRAMVKFIRYKLPGAISSYITRGFQSTVDGALLIIVVIVECAFEVTREILSILNKHYTTNRISQGVLYHGIYFLARYLYYPMIDLLSTMTTDKIPDPLCESNDAGSGKDPIKIAQRKFRESREQNVLHGGFS